VILDSVVGSSSKNLGNLSPPVAELPVSNHELALFLVRPTLLVQRRIQVVEPSFSTLFCIPIIFTKSLVYYLAKQTPFLQTMLLNKLYQKFIFIGAEGGLFFSFFPIIIALGVAASHCGLNFIKRWLQPDLMTWILFNLN